MDDRIRKIATWANATAYNAQLTQRYVDGAPHIKHESLRTLHAALAVEVFDRAQTHSPIPYVLDLGAGEGSVTLAFLGLGARVKAIDISPSQLDSLRVKCRQFGEMLEVQSEDIAETLKDSSKRYDVIVVNSFLHHVPDYLSLIEAAIPLLRPGGQFFAFQDPLRYDSLTLSALAFSKLGYVSWRLCQGDVLGGTIRRLRRARGIYRENSMHDNAEYHVVRNGVDQEAIVRLFEKQQMKCRIIKYFSTQGRLFQGVGSKLGLENTFSAIATKE